MKKVFLLLTIITSFTLISFSQPELTGAIGLTFGMNKSMVKSVILQKGGTLFDEKENSVSFSDIPIGSKTSDLMGCQFIHNNLHTICCIFASPLESQTQDLYDDLKSILVSKYGNPQKSFRHFTGIYSDGDGYEMQAVRLGYAIISSYWTFKDNNVIYIEIEAVSGGRMIVKITYQNDKLSIEVENEKSNKNKSEF